MDFEALKLGFKSYLEEISQNSNKTYVTDNSDVSIFMYANEFKNYITDELNTDESIFSKSINDILKMDIVNGKLVDSNKTQNDEEEANITDILNSLLEDSGVIEALDTDKSGELNEDEIITFLNTINSGDGDFENLTLDDIFTGIEQIKNGTLELQSSEEISQPEIEQPEEIATAAPQSSGGASSGGSTGSSSFTPSTNPATTKNQNNDITEKTLDNMTKEELNSELNTAQTDLSDKQNNLSSILDGSDPAIAQLKENVDKTYEAYLNELKTVDEDMADDLDTLKTTIDNQESQIDAKEQEISDQETTVKNCETNYNNAVSKRESLEASRDALSASLSGATEEQKAEINAKIAELDSQIEAAKTAEQNAKTELEEAEILLTELESEKTALEEQLDVYKAEMTLLENDIKTAYPEIAELMTEYKTAKQNLTTEKAAAISNAKSEIQGAQDYVNEVQTAINNFEIKELEAENSLDPKNQYNAEAGQALAKNALNVPGTTGWCLAGVNNSLMRTYGVGFSGLGSAYMAIEALRGNSPGNEEIASHFVEVQVDRSELANLPAGAIVVWDNNANGGGSNVSDLGKIHGHISISLGNGQESSDHIQGQTVNRDADFYVFLPVS